MNSQFGCDQIHLSHPTRQCDGRRPICTLCEKRKQDCVFSDRRYRGPSKKRLREEPADAAAKGLEGVTESILSDPSLPPNALATPQSHDLSAFRDALIFDAAGMPFPFDDPAFDTPETYIVSSEEGEGEGTADGDNGIAAEESLSDSSRES